MTNEQAIEMMKAKLECMTRDNGTDLNCNAKKCDECNLCYAQGNMGEQEEWLRIGIKALENQQSVIELLRNLRAEIQDKADNTPYTNQLSVDAHKLDIDIINKHIAELKGE